MQENLLCFANYQKGSHFPLSYVLVAHNNFPPFSPNPVSSRSGIVRLQACFFAYGDTSAFGNASPLLPLSKAVFTCLLAGFPSQDHQEFIRNGHGILPLKLINFRYPTVELDRGISSRAGTTTRITIFLQPFLLQLFFAILPHGIYPSLDGRAARHACALHCTFFGGCLAAICMPVL